MLKSKKCKNSNITKKAKEVRSSGLRHRCCYCGKKRFGRFMTQLTYSKSWICLNHLK